MPRRAIRIAAAVVGAALFASTGLAAAAAPPRGAETEAKAAIIRISVPDQPEVTLGELVWPSTTTAEVQSFAYPNDGTVVTTGQSRAATTAQRGPVAVTQATAETIALSVFGGDVLAAQVTASASAGASTRSAGADVAGSIVQGLRVLGQDVPSTPGTIPLSDWGTLYVLAQSTGSRRGTAPAAQGSVAVLRVHLTAAHGGLPAGSEIVVGEASATAVVEAAPAPSNLPHGAEGAPRTGSDQVTGGPRPPEQQTGEPAIPGGPVRAAPPGVAAALTRDGYVFPIYGPASFGDSFGAPRPDIQGGWHHGEDIFAPLGAPVLAVASGTLHSIGFIPIGGYRLWLRDGEGNEFYYAHLSAYSPLAVEGKQRRGGRRHRLRGGNGGRRRWRGAPPLRDPPRGDDRARLRRRRRPVPVPRRLAPSGGRVVRRRPDLHPVGHEREHASAPRSGAPGGRRHRVPERTCPGRSRERPPAQTGLARPTSRQARCRCPRPRLPLQPRAPRRTPRGLHRCRPRSAP